MSLAGLSTAIAGTTFVPAGANLQNALNAAQPGDTLVLQAGATYVGNFFLPVNNSNQWITIQSSAIGSLPAGTRVTNNQTSSMAKIVTPNSGAALVMSTGANYYRFQGLEITPAAGIYIQDLIQVGNGGENSVGALPHNIDFDRDYIHGEASNGGKRGIAMNGVQVSVENSWISAFFSTWQDTQAIAGWNGPGPYQITNNYLEAATETVAFGGAPTAIYGVVPSDILVQNNSFNKPLTWNPSSSSFAGVAMWVKNHIELKNAQRMTIDGNTFDNVWVGADQRGFQLVFNVRTEIGHVPWAVVNNITVTGNRFRHSAAGIVFTAHDDNPPGSGSSSGFMVKNNSFEDVSSNWGGDGRLFEVLGANNLTIDHNTSFQTGFEIVFDIAPATNFVYTNNISAIGWGVAGDGAGYGTSALNAFAPGGVFSNNVLIGGNAGQYPANNFFPGSVSNVGFTDFANSVFNLLSSSPYAHAATDGSSLGSTLGTGSTTTATPASGPTIPTGWVNIVSKNSGKCADIAGISTSPLAILQQWGCWGGDNQKFQFTPVNGGYEITVKNSGLQLDIAGGPAVTWDGGQFIQWPYWGGSNEIFKVQPTSDGYWNIIPTSSGRCMDERDGSLADGALITQWYCYGGDNQKWSLNPTN